MTAKLCPQSGEPAPPCPELNGEGITICPGCAHVVLVVDDTIRAHRPPQVAA